MELEQKALRLHMNPHFIFNAINAIHGFYSSGESEVAKRYISKFSQLLRMLLESSSLRYISLQKEEEMLISYCTLNELRFPEKFSFSIQISDSINKEIIGIPPMILQPFVENSLLHGIGPLKHKGDLRITISQNEKYLICEIKDNGIGRKGSSEINAGRLHQSTGIKVTEERIKAHFTKFDDQIPLEIIDLYNNEQAPCGTLVRVKINIYKLV